MSKGKDSVWCEYNRLKRVVAGWIPAVSELFCGDGRSRFDLCKEKGRKHGYRQFDLIGGKWIDKKSELQKDCIPSFIEVSRRAAGCPMPLNVDVWDGVVCPYGCLYCFANYFRASLYHSFVDNAREVGLRYCDPKYFLKELDGLMKWRGSNQDCSGVRKAVALGVPMRVGIRFEDFLPVERKRGVTLELLKYLCKEAYPVMVNTKSDLVAEDKYLRVLADNPAGAAVHMTLVSSDDRLLKKIEPGAPSYRRRMEAMRRLAEAGVRVVARVEPYLLFWADKRWDTFKYQEDLWDAGVRNVTFDTYSWSAMGYGFRELFRSVGLDWERLFLLESDSQWLGSFLLGRYMGIWRDRGFSCSTFDLGNVIFNDQDVCCEVGDWFRGGWNRGSAVMAIRYVAKAGGRPVRWKEFEGWVNEGGGFLSEDLGRSVKMLWNCEESGLDAYNLEWAAGLEIVGADEDGLVWRKVDGDYRERLFESLSQGESKWK